MSASASSAPVTSSSRDLRAAARSCASCVPRRVVATTERWSLGAAGHPSSGGGGGGANVSRDASVATRPVTSAGLDAHGPEQPRTPPAGNQAWGVGDLTRQKMTHGEHSKVKSTTTPEHQTPREAVWRPGRVWRVASPTQILHCFGLNDCGGCAKGKANSISADIPRPVLLLELHNPLVRVS